MAHARLAVLATAAVALAVPLTAAGTAAGSTTPTSTTVVVHSGLPKAITASDFDCTTSESVPSTNVHLHGPSTPPLGAGSLALRGTSDRNLFLFGTHPASDLTAFAVSIYGTNAFDNELDLTMELNSDANGADFLNDTVQAAPKWTRVNALTVTLELSHLANAGGVTTDEGPTTYAAYLTAHPGATLDNLGVGSSGCLYGQDLDIDDLAIGISGDITTYDFEPDTAVMSIHAPATFHKGAQVTISGVLTRHGTPIADEPIVLEAKPAGAKTWRFVTQATTSYDGAYYYLDYPPKTTSFKFVLAGDSNAGQLTSKAVTAHLVPVKKKRK